MAAVTIRNLSDATHRALKARARQHGRSTEAEIRSILDEAARPIEPLGTRLAVLGGRLDGPLPVPPRTDPPEPADFS